LNELRNAISSLDALVRAVRDGQAEFVDDIASRLRALIYWSPSNSSYNPLLLRLAARRRLPLPVFAFSDKHPRAPKVLEDAQLHISFNYPTPIRVYPKQRLMDLQSYLQTTVQLDRSGALVPIGSSFAVWQQTANDIIRDAASTIGSANYDDTVPVGLDRLRQMRTTRTDSLAPFLIKISLAVGELARYVLRDSGRWP
jgi:hypothetical protein